jgi:phospholipase C
LPFFALYPAALPHVLGPNFKRYEYLAGDRKTEADRTAPQVIIVEPYFLDTPHSGPGHPNDNHAPLAVAWGEQFLRRVFVDAQASPARWARTVMIVYYDEHGGFWDHVAPPRIPYEVLGAQPHSFKSLGPRIPAMVISPLVNRGSVCHVTMDHTSVLQFLAELFTPGTPYSAGVEERRGQGIASVSSAIQLKAPRAVTPAPPTVAMVASTDLGTGLKQVKSDMAESFELAANKLLTEEPEGTAAKYPELFQWKAMMAVSETPHASDSGE